MLPGAELGGRPLQKDVWLFATRCPEGVATKRLGGQELPNAKCDELGKLQITTMFLGVRAALLLATLLMGCPGK